MDFKNTRDNLTALEEERPISSEEMFELFGVMMEDVYSHNRLLGYSRMEAEDKGGLILAVQYILKEALQTIENNQEGIQELSTKSQNECQSLFYEIRKKRKSLEEIQGRIDEKKRTQADFEKRSKELEAKKRELREIESEYKNLQEQTATYIELFNALNAALGEPLIRDRLFDVNGTDEILNKNGDKDLQSQGSKIQSLEDLEKWMTRIQDEIEQLINTYQVKLQHVLKASGMIIVPFGNES